MVIAYKDEQVKDIMNTYFHHPIWDMKTIDSVPDVPLDIQLEFINRCNLKCDYCNYPYNTRKKSLLDWKTLKSVVDQSADIGVCYFTICGIGEASLHPDLFRFLRYVRDTQVEEKGMRVLPFMPTILITNGMWKSSQVQEMIDNPPDVLSLSLGGLTDEEIVKHRVGINLNHFWESVERVYKERHVVRPIDGGLSPTIHISTNIYPSEFSTRMKDVEIFRRKWFDISDIIVTKAIMLTPQFKDYSKFVDDDKKMGYVNITKTGYERTLPCFETSRRLSVNSDGNAWCGHNLSETFGQFLGNIKEQSLYDIWNGKAMTEFRNKVRTGVFERPQCKECGEELRTSKKNTL